MEGHDPQREGIEVNRRSWDERTPLHVASDFYGVDEFLAGRESLAPVEVDEIGSVAEASLLHLQCHFGLDTMSWARRGASVTGLDFSEAAIHAARSIAAQAGIDANFVCGNVYDAVKLVEGSFDIVYTGLGALNWLPDIPRWARVVASLMKPGGRFYLLEFHPLAWMLSDEEIAFDPQYSYFFTPEGVVIEDDRDYADPDARLTNVVTHEWAHPLSEVISALVDAGLRIEFVHEFDTIAYQRWPFLEEVEEGSRRYRIPEGRPKIPLEYSILATRDE